MVSYRGYGPRNKAAENLASGLNTGAQPLPGQTLNNAGGWSWATTDEQHLERFLRIGSKSGTYYVTEQKLTQDALDMVVRLVKAGRGEYVLQRVIAVSESRDAISADPALFVLAYLMGVQVYPRITQTIKRGKDKGKQRDYLDPRDIALRHAAFVALPKVANTGTKMLHLAAMHKEFGGWGDGVMKAFRRWYTESDSNWLAYQLLKYQQRDTWSQKDILRLTHPDPRLLSEDHQILLHWVAKGWESIGTDPHPHDAIRRIWAHELAKKQVAEKSVNHQKVAALVKEFRLPREAVPSEALAHVDVWESLLVDMPMEAMTRNLATMTRNGTLAPMSELTNLVVSRLRDPDAIRKSGLHPIKILAALTTYSQGKGQRSSNTWTPLPQITAALSDAFYLAYKNAEATGLRTMFTIDISDSMNQAEVNGIPGLKPFMAAAALALVVGNSEPNVVYAMFDTTAQLAQISPNQRLDDVFRYLSGMRHGGTDTSATVLMALAKKIPVDVFVQVTDSESWANRGGWGRHESTALKDYRQAMGINARLINIQTVANTVSNLDPNDPGVMEVVGFGPNVPQAIATFLRLTAQ